MRDSLFHWHPVLESAMLKKKPMPFTLVGKPYVLFRTQGGSIGCLLDQCPHRRMPLSCGSVSKNHLHCRYHGWSFDNKGVGQSPGNPRLDVHALGLEALDRNGFIWVRRWGATSTFPIINVDGYRLAGHLSVQIQAPMMLVLDNFSEVEHTATIHRFLGHSLEDMPAVTVEIVKEDTHIRVLNKGPQRPTPALIRRLLSFKKDDIFVDDWRTYFSPIHSVFDQYIVEPKTGHKRPEHFKNIVYFTPETEETTGVFVSVYARSTRSVPSLVKRMVNPFFRALIHHEVQLDAQLLNRLTNKDISLKGMKLGRFDGVLGLNRSYADRLYYGRESVG